MKRNATKGSAQSALKTTRQVARARSMGFNRSERDEDDRDECAFLYSAEDEDENERVRFFVERNKRD